MSKGKHTVRVMSEELLSSDYLTRYSFVLLFDQFTPTLRVKRRREPTEKKSRSKGRSTKQPTSSRGYMQRPRVYLIDVTLYSLSYLNHEKIRDIHTTRGTSLHELYGAHNTSYTRAHASMISILLHVHSLFYMCADRARDTGGRACVCPVRVRT